MEKTWELAALIMAQSHHISAYPDEGRGLSPKPLHAPIKQEMGPDLRRGKWGFVVWMDWSSLL